MSILITWTTDVKPVPFRQQDDIHQQGTAKLFYSVFMAKLFATKLSKIN